MAYVTLPSPGKIVNDIEIGPCKQNCIHSDCIITREQAETLCHVCKKPIGYETAYQVDGVDFIHLACIANIL